MNTTIFKTKNVIKNPKVGYNKFIVNFPEGLKVQLGENQGLRMFSRQGVIEPHIKVYNGTLWNVDETVCFDDNYLVETTTDDYGNTIKEYLISGYWGVDSCYVHATLGTTRIEVLDFSTRYSCVYYGGEGMSTLFVPEELCDISVYKCLDITSLVCKANLAYGDVDYFKENENLEQVNILGTNISGNINAFVKSAAKGLTFMYMNQCAGMYGELTEILDAMATREDVRGQTFTTWGFGGTAVTYKGKFISKNGIIIAFDNSGNYTVDGQ